MIAFKCFVAKLYMIKYVKIDPINFGLQELHLIRFTRKTNLQTQEEHKVTIRKCWINQRYEIRDPTGVVLVKIVDLIETRVEKDKISENF